MLGSADLAQFFDPTRYARADNEIDLLAPDGALMRIDRLVTFRDHGAIRGQVWVLDYKSQHRAAMTESSRDLYCDQLRRYRAAIEALHPDRHVHTALLFGDATLVEFDPDGVAAPS